MPAVPKLNPIRDRRYLDWLRTQPCIVSGVCGPSVDPAHISTMGKGIKSSDDECLPLLNSHHKWAHDHGEMTFWRTQAPDWLLRAALKAYARELYQKWLSK